MKKFLLTSALVAGFASAAVAAEAPKVTVGGSLNTQYGFVSQKSAFKYTGPNSAVVTPSPANKIRNNALVNETYITVKVDGEAEMLKYGAFVKLRGNTSAPKQAIFGSNDSTRSPAEQTMAYIDTMFGRFEGGMYTGASSSMRVNGSNFAAGTGGISGDSVYWVNQSVDNAASTLNPPPSGASNNTGSVFTNFILTPDLFTNYIGTAGIQGVNAAKLTYYTPTFAGFSAGLSYTPDNQVNGTVNTFSSDLNKNTGFKNIFELGLQYATQLDQVGIKVAAIGEYGTPKDSLNNYPLDFNGYNNSSNVGTNKSKLKSWEIGTNLSYMGFTVGGSYGSWGKAGAPKDAVNAGVTTALKTKTSNYWTAGLGYAYGPANVSLTYLGSKLGLAGVADANKFTNLVFSADYKLAPGLLPYFEVSSFKMTDKRIITGTTTNAVGNKGTVVLVGTKLQF